MNKPLPIAIITSRGFRGENSDGDIINHIKRHDFEIFLHKLCTKFIHEEERNNPLIIHSTFKTADAIKKILSTIELIDYKDFQSIEENNPLLIKYNYGSKGGTVQIATKCVNKELYAVILLLDPDNFKSNNPENRALMRICIRKKIPLLTSIRAAYEWYDENFDTVFKEYNKCEANKLKEDDKTLFKTEGSSERDAIFDGFPSNTNIKCSARAQTIALISHDEKKKEMIQFVENYPDVLSSFYRILATGTTGWLIKTLFADEQLRSKYLRLAKEKLGNDRYAEFIKTSTKIQEELWLSGFPKPCPPLVKKLFPLASGPEGGDILIANEVLKKKCDYIIFTQDPMHAHPHSADISLLQRTCQITEHNAVCISDKDSAEVWAKEKQKTWRLYEYE